MSIPQELLAEHVHRGAGIRRLLRILLVAFFAAVLLTEPPGEHLALCWLLVGSYLVWSLATYAAGNIRRTQRLLWPTLYVDVAVLAALTLITDTVAADSWAPYLIINGFFLIPVIAAAQLSPFVCTAVLVPAVVVYLVSGLITQDVGAEPTSYVLLRTGMLATVCLGAILLSRLQRSRVATIAGLLTQRSTLLAEMITIEQREQRELAETLHDGALQYVLGARLELDDLVGSGGRADPETVRRIDQALTESARLLRSTMAQLHPAVIEQTGLLPALRDLVESTRARGRLTITLTTDGWSEGDRTDVDELLLAAARELLTNVVKHADATTVAVHLGRLADDEAAPSAELTVVDDGRGLGEVDLDQRLADGHLGLASRRIRLAAVGGRLDLLPHPPHGTVARVVVPLR